MGCIWCENIDLGMYSASVDKTHATIYTAGGSKRFPKGMQFRFCPVCGALLNLDPAPRGSNGMITALLAYAHKAENKQLEKDIWEFMKTQEPLTIEDIRERDGFPIWDDLDRRWLIVHFSPSQSPVLWGEGGPTCVFTDQFGEARPIYYDCPKEEC